MVVDRYGRATAVAALVVTLGWHVGNDLPAMLSAWSQYSRPALVAAVWLGYLLLAAAFGGVLVRGRAPGRWAAAGTVPLLLLGAATVHAASGHASVFGAANWAWPAVGWFALLVLWH